MLLKPRVLIAEDDDAIVEMVEIAFQGAGLACLRAKNGARALDMLRLYAPDLLVLDVMMPVMDGIEAARLIRQGDLLTDIPILMLTALSSLDDKVEGLDAGADAYLSKPFDVRELIAQIHALLRARRNRRERHPTTELPGPGAVVDTLQKALGKSGGNSVIHIAAREFDRYAQGVAFGQAAAFQASFTDMLQRKLREHFLFVEFLGHLGGGSFVVVLPSDKAAALASDIAESFGSAHTAWLGHGSPVESMTLAVAVAHASGLQAGDIQVLAARLAAAAKIIP